MSEISSRKSRTALRFPFLAAGLNGDVAKLDRETMMHGVGAGRKSVRQLRRVRIETGRSTRERAAPGNLREGGVIAGQKVEIDWTLGPT